MVEDKNAILRAQKIAELLARDRSKQITGELHRVNLREPNTKTLTAFTTDTDRVHYTPFTVENKIKLSRTILFLANSAGTAGTIACALYKITNPGFIVRPDPGAVNESGSTPEDIDPALNFRLIRPFGVVTIAATSGKRRLTFQLESDELLLPGRHAYALACLPKTVSIQFYVQAEGSQEIGHSGQYVTTGAYDFPEDDTAGTQRHAMPWALRSRIGARLYPL